jgi:hypothetical protein
MRALRLTGFSFKESHVMANTFSPFGFLQYNGGMGGAPTFAQSQRKIASSNSTPIYFGDPVMPVISTATGYITQGAAGTTTLAGIFVGCTYVSVAQGRRVWSRYYPGSDSNGDAIAYVIDDPAARFLVQTNNASFLNATWTATTQGTLPIGQYAQFTIGTGTTANGLSGAYLSSVGTTVTFPFIVVDYVTFPPGQNGTDPSTLYANVIVGFNNEIFRTNGAGPTGIS